MARGSSSRSRRWPSSRGPVLVVGAFGQDGTLLRRRLEAEGRRILPLGSKSRPSVLDERALAAYVRRHRPAEAYYLAAVHAGAEGGGKDGFSRAYAVHVTGLRNTLEALRAHAPACRLVYASSSRVFGTKRRGLLDETTPLAPEDDYGFTKALGMLLCRHYRETRGVFASSAILFNHESALRAPRFLSRRIVDGLLAVKRAGRGRLVLRDPSARADWMWAPDAVRAMTLIARAPRPGDFVVAGGRTHTARQFAARAARALGLPAAAGRPEAGARAGLRRGVAAAGDTRRLRRLTGWRPSVDFDGMVRALARELSEAR